MKNSEELSQKKEEFMKFLDEAGNSKLKDKQNVEFPEEVIHPNSLITKNISLFTKNPNYKLLAWLACQLLIFSLFIQAMSFFKNNFIPYINSI